jgi:hypothetical protein
MTARASSATVVITNGTIVTPQGRIVKHIARHATLSVQATIESHNDGKEAFTHIDELYFR